MIGGWTSFELDCAAVELGHWVVGGRPCHSSAILGDFDRRLKRGRRIGRREIPVSRVWTIWVHLVKRGDGANFG